MTEPLEAPDIAIPGDFPGGEAIPDAGELRIAIDRKPYAEMIAHGARDPDIEVCGVLVGQVGRDRHGPFVHITHVIEGARAAEQGAQVTFTHDTWSHINAEMDRLHEGRRIVGWYHTHPDFGVFLSEMDLFLHRNFFGASWQVAHVYDPLSGAEGFFHVPGDAQVTARRYWLGGRQRRIAVKAALATAAVDPNVALVRAVQSLHTSLGANREPATPPALWVVAGLLGVLVLGQMWGATSEGRADPGALVVLQEDAATGVKLGIRVYPVARSGAAMVPLYRDAADNQYYGVEVESIAPTSPLDLRQILAGSSELRLADPAAPTEAPKAEARRTAARAGPSSWLLLAVVGTVLASAVGSVAWFSRRARRQRASGR